MGRPTHRPRLTELDSREVEAALLASVEGALTAAGSTLTATQRVELRLSAAQIAQWAKAGALVDGWDARRVEQALVGFARLLYAGTVSDGLERLRTDEIPISDCLGLACVAAWARVLLARGESITAKQIATLAGCDPQHVRFVSRDGELRMEAGKIDAEEARRWLRARGDRPGRRS